MANFKKHKVWFEEAATVFADPLAKTSVEPKASENRFITIGQSDLRRLLLVVHFEKDDDEIRIISARTLEPKERKQYEEGI